MTKRSGILARGLFRRKISSILLSAAILLLHASAVRAAVTGRCYTCHTMHYSQLGTTLSEWSSGGPFKFLLTKTCLACHTGTNTGVNTTPFIFKSTEPNYGGGIPALTGTGTAGAETLAGGSFYWVNDGDDSAGHNVDELPGNPDDGTHGNTPPGGSALPGHLTCAGAYGCHGNRQVNGNYDAMSGTHHGLTMTDSFRWLENNDGSYTDIAGLEDGDWEYQADATHHNQYKGVARSPDDTDADVTTISSFCASCHDDFHHGNGVGEGIYDGSTWGSPWIRHPVDYDMNGLGGEYTYANYSVIAPVASESVATVLSVGLGATQKIIMCPSCHRAHGSPFPAAMRWNYRDWPGVNGYAGCAICHTAKD